MLPRAVVRPRHADEIVAALEVCRTLGVPLTMRGAGHLDRRQRRRARRRHRHQPAPVAGARRRRRGPDGDVEPGVVQAALQEAVQPHGPAVRARPEHPQPLHVGGMIGNNACGSRALGYGRTSDNVVGLDVVTGGGDRLRLGPGTPRRRRPRRPARLVAGELATIRTELGRFGRQVSGYSLEHLLPEHGFDVAKALVGSEGTLALVLGATVRLVADAPLRGLVVLGYPTMADAADATPGLLPHSPTAVEGLDARIVQRLRDVPAAVVPDLPRGEGWLIVELTGETAPRSRPRPGGWSPTPARWTRWW